jgi:hypothetical protein
VRPAAKPAHYKPTRYGYRLLCRARLRLPVAIAILIAALLVAVDRYQVITERQRADQDRAEQTLTAPTRAIVTIQAALDTRIVQGFGTLTAGAQLNDVAATRGGCPGATRTSQDRTGTCRCGSYGHSRGRDSGSAGDRYRDHRGGLTFWNRDCSPGSSDIRQCYCQCRGSDSGSAGDRYRNRRGGLTFSNQHSSPARECDDPERRHSECDSYPASVNDCPDPGRRLSVAPRASQGCPRCARRTDLDPLDEAEGYRKRLPGASASTSGFRVPGVTHVAGVEASED